MYALLHELLADKKGGLIFTCFGLWHFLFLGIFLACSAAAVYYIYNIEEGKRGRVIDSVITIAFTVYIADFFLMPLAYGYIDIEKLPFHVCTVTCVLCFLSRKSTRLRKYRVAFAAFGFLSNLVYLIYPAGVMWHAVHPLSYRVLQTFLFHGCMSVYGLLTLLFEAERQDGRRYLRDLCVICSVVLWAVLGNLMYNGTAEGYSYFFNWFFVVRDPFYLLPERIAPYVMPPLNAALFFGAERLVYLVVLACNRNIKLRGEK